jgi:hypothetical protein
VLVLHALAAPVGSSVVIAAPLAPTITHGPPAIHERSSARSPSDGPDWGIAEAAIPHVVRVDDGGDVLLIPAGLSR